MKDAYRRTFELSELVSAYYFSTQSAAEEGRVMYPFSRIYLILRGTVTFWIDGKEYEVRAGMMCYAPAHTPFSFYWKGDAVEFGLISFVCRSEAMKRFFGAPLPLGEEEQVVLFDVIKTAARIYDGAREKVTPQREMRLRPDTPDVVIGFIYASLERFLSMVYCRLQGISLLVSESQKVNRQVDKTRLVASVKAYLEAHVCERVTVQSLCTHFGIGQTALMQKFREETNQTLIEHFNDIKIGRAKEMIRKSSMSFGEIAEALGFSSVNYFSKMFKARVGMTLTEYSRQVSKRRAVLE